MTKVSNPLISIIVPIWNVEKYLDKCVESMINQTYQNLEIILVDDESPDNCPKMCDEWAKKDNRIRVIHKKNGHISDARNAGLNIATGKYITFIDSDDYIEPNYIEFLYNNLIENDADISMGKHYVRYPRKTLNTGSGNIYVVNPHDCLEKLLYGEDFDVSAWAKLYKKELFDEIRFPKGRIFEDAATTYKLIDKSKKIVLNSQPIYNYIMRKNSTINDEFKESMFELITSTTEMTDYVINKYPDLKKACNRRNMYAYLSTLTQLAKSKRQKKEYRIRLMNYIKANREEVLKDKRIPKRDRFSLLSTYLGFGFFKLSWKFYSLIRK